MAYLYQHSAVSLSRCITCQGVCVQQSHMRICRAPNCKKL